MNEKIIKLAYEAEKQKSAVLVGVSLRKDNVQKIFDYLDELEFLARTYNIKVVKKFYQRLERPNPKTFVGRGKFEEIKQFVKENKIDLIIFDDELSPAQARNIETETGVEIIDRTKLILNIFAFRAKTDIAKKQVELAEYKYLKSRLRGMWTHLEKQKGGIGLKGPGEKELETDRRRVNKRIQKLEKELKQIEKQMTTRRKNRSEFVQVALVGYTNVGKSTLMNLLAKERVFVENKLFATLDTITRRIDLWNIPILLSDTVGFIRKLPTLLIKAFKSTLDEVREADILLHVVDISHPNFEEHINVVNNTLVEINAADKPKILVFNKIDAYKFKEKDPYDLSPKTKENFSLEDLKQMWLAKSEEPTVFISAKNKINIDELRKVLYLEAKKIYYQRFPNKKSYYTDFMFENEPK